jgi:GntR family transcriptional regulator
MRPVGDARTPLHLEVRDAIAQDIAAGLTAPSERLPSERDLCERLNVSRLTLRKALKLLVEDGLVESAPGRGWFVAGGPVSEPANELLSFTDMARARGFTPSAAVLSTQVRCAALDEAEALMIAPGRELFEIRRLRRLDGAATSIDHSRIPLAVAPWLPEVDFTTTSLYSELRDHGVEPTRANAVVEAVPANAEQARLLEVAIGTPLLSLSQITFAQDGRPIDMGNVTYRGDRYRFRANLLAWRTASASSSRSRATR